MGAPLDDPAGFDDDDLVDSLEAGQPVSDEQRGATLGEGQQVGGQGVGGVGVEVLRRLVEHEDGEVGQERPRDGHALALAAREARPHGTHLGAQALGEAGEPLAQPDADQDGGQLVVGGGATADPEVLGQRRVEEVGALLDQAHDTTHVVRRQALQWDAVQRRLPGVGGKEAHEHVGQGRLAGSARPDERHAPAGAQVQVDAPQRGASRPGVGGPHVTEGQRVRPVTDCRRRLGLHDGRPGIDGGEDASRRHP